MYVSATKELEWLLKFEKALSSRGINWAAITQGQPKYVAYVMQNPKVCVLDLGTPYNTIEMEEGETL